MIDLCPLNTIYKVLKHARFQFDEQIVWAQFSSGTVGYSQVVGQPTYSNPNFTSSA